MVARLDAATSQQRGGVVDSGVGVIDESGHDGAAARGLVGELLKGVEVLADELAAQHEVLGRVAGDRELGERDEVGAGLGRVSGGVGHPSDVAGQVADGEVQLTERDASHAGSLPGVAGYSVPPMSTL